MRMTVASLPIASKKDGFCARLLHVRFASGDRWAYAKSAMTGNRDSSSPANVREDDDKPRSMRSGPPPPPVRKKPTTPPPAAPKRSVPPPPPSARAAAARHQPPPPPKRSPPPLPSVTAARAVSSLPPPPIPTVKAPSVPPPLPQVVQAVAPAPAEPPAVVEQVAVAEQVALAAEPAEASPPAPVTTDVTETTEQSPTAEAAEPTIVAEPSTAAEPAIAAATVSEPEPQPELAPEPSVAEPQPELAPEPSIAAAATPESQPEAAPEPVTETSVAPEPSVAAEASVAAEPSVAEAATPESEPVSEPEPSVNPAAFEQPAAEAAPRFNSTASDAPVVLSTPLPRVPESRRLPQQLWSLPKDWLPRAQSWSQKNLRNAPRTLVISAPFVALLAIWLGHSLSAHHKHAAAQPVPAPIAQATVAAPEPVVVPETPPVPAAPPAAVEAPAAPAVLSAVAETASTTALAPALAAPVELAHALTRGLPALEALAAKFPADAQVAIALAGQQAQAQRYEAAVATVEHVIEVDPSSAQNGKVMGILWRAAQSPAADQSFLFLRKLGARGSDIAFDLATTSGVRESVRTRAKAELTNYLAFDASGDTRAATALLLAPDCATRKALLDRAESDGGKRTLSMLERFARGAGCTSSSEGSCNSCLMGSPVLTHALSKLNPEAKP
jgi:hypothetical protein